MAVNTVVTAGSAATLLSWTRTPPAGVDLYELKIGMADAFGRMKTKQAIPFLIRNISIDRTQAVNTWAKTGEVVQSRLAAAAALIGMGSDAASAVAKAAWGPMTAEDRRAAIFVISRMQDSQVTRDFCISALGFANVDRYWAEDGLNRIQAH